MSAGKPSGLKLAGALFGVLVVFALSRGGSRNVPAGPAERGGPPSPPPPAPLVLPGTGVLTQQYYVEYGNPQAPLEITTNNSGRHTYVKMQKADDNFTAMTFFIRSGETLTHKVPPSTYRIKYATGRVWYGESELFGKETDCFQAGETFVFAIEGNRAAGHRIELILQPRGNLSTRQISRKEF